MKPKPVIFLIAALGVAVLSAGIAQAVSDRHSELGNAQEVADATFPSVHRYWQDAFASAGVSYHAAKRYWWYNKAYNRRWIPVAKDCDRYQKQRDGKMWGAQSPEYLSNSFYCSIDEQIFLDWTWLQTIGFRTTYKWGRGDDARVALVIAHEYGHHIQKLLGFPYAKRRAGQVANFELHADCYAGAWFAYGEGTGLMERADTLNANTLLGYLGDADATPWNEATAHGGHSDRQEWFLYGYETSNPQNCDEVFN